MYRSPISDVWLGTFRTRLPSVLLHSRSRTWRLSILLVDPTLTLRLIFMNASSRSAITVPAGHVRYPGIR